ncbi:hypothetical protein NP493_453g02006 [Ridgeia piscesae]|uniref:Uncharacterized protein n=1 Tax=Ridgeia piscesae TaxID=27915 RepID=A0AAD9KZF5_RIDPI|nr:hypothetical protein NP493_453g02006 [Ridgeia piscesae]
MKPGDRMLVILPRVPEWWLLNIACCRMEWVSVGEMLAVCPVEWSGVGECRRLLAVCPVEWSGRCVDTWYNSTDRSRRPPQTPSVRAKCVVTDAATADNVDQVSGEGPDETQHLVLQVGGWAWG